MDISLFDYELDKDLIAQFPCSPRDSSRLLSCLDNVPKDFNFKKLPEILNSGDILVINNTKVIPSRLFGQRDNVAYRDETPKDRGLRQLVTHAKKYDRTCNCQTKR